MASSARIDELRKKFDENPRRYFAPLANEYRKAGDLEQAVFICQEYLPQQPGHMSGHIVYGQALFEQGQFDAARGVFETALSLDPENLIALRHLGDIARQAGDTSSARVWYQRVLEADPRNEEIAQLMMSLLSTPAGTPVVDHTAPTPLSTPAVTAGAETIAPARPTPINTYTLPLPEEPSAATVTPPPSPFAPPPAPELTPESFISRHAPSEDELLDLDSFDLGGVPLSSLRSTKTDEDVGFAPTPPSTEAIAFDEVSAEPPREVSAEVEHDVSVDGESVLGQEDGTDVEIEKSEGFSGEFEADPYAVAARGSEESIVDQREELDTAIEVTSSLDLSDAIDEAAPSDGSDAPVEGLEAFESGLIAGRTSSALNAVEGLSTESFYDSPADVPDSDDSGFIDDAAAFIAMPVEEFTAPAASTADVAPVVANEFTVDGPADVGGDEAGLGEASAFDAPGIEVETLDAAPDEISAIAEPAADEVLAEEAAIELSASAFPPAEATAVEVESEPLPTPASSESVDEPLIVLPPALGTPRFNVAMAETPVFVEAGGTPPFGADTVGGEPVAAEAVEVENVEVEDIAVESVAVESVETEAVAAEVAEPVEEPSLSTADDETDAAQPAGAFVTETMAALYLEQGHYEAALDIYRQLVAQRPEDIALRERLHAAEARAWGKSQELGASIVDDEPIALNDAAAPIEFQPPVYDGPTIRDFLSSVIFRRAIEDVAPAANAYAEDSAVAVEELPTDDGSPELAQELASDAVAEPFEVPADVHPAPSVERETVRGSLGALFSEADAAAQATSEPLTTHATPLAGAPAHRAVSELSLDHVFKTNAAPRRSTDEFSFDQFFSEESASSNAQAPTEAPTPETSGAREPSDDIAQFNAWLNGLKKS